MSGDFYLTLTPTLTGVQNLSNADCTGLSFADALGSMIRQRKFSVALTLRIHSTRLSSGSPTVPDAAPVIPIFMIHYDATARNAAERCRIVRFERPLSSMNVHDTQGAFIVEPRFLVTNQPNFSLFQNIAGIVDAINVAPVDIGATSAVRELDSKLGTLFGGAQSEGTAFQMTFAGDQRARQIRAVHVDSRNTRRNVDIGVRLELVPRRSALHAEEQLPHLYDLLSLSPPRVADVRLETVDGSPKAFSELFADDRFPMRGSDLPNDRWAPQDWNDLGIQCSNTRTALRTRYALSASDANLVTLALLVQHTPAYFRGPETNIYPPCMTRLQAESLIRANGRPDELQLVQAPPPPPRTPVAQAAVAGSAREAAIALIMRPLVASLYIRPTATAPGRPPTIEEFRTQWSAILGDQLETFSVVDERESGRVDATGQAAVDYLSRFSGSRARGYNANDNEPLERGVVATLLATIDGQYTGELGIVVESQQTPDLDLRYRRVRIVENYDAAMRAIGVQR